MTDIQSATAEIRRGIKKRTTTTPHHNRFTALFPEPPRWAGTRGELLDFMVQRKIKQTHQPSGWAPVHPDQAVPTSTIPPFFTGQIPFLLPNQQCESTEGN